MVELTLFGLLALVSFIFFVNHFVFGGKLFKKENTGFLIDLVKYGTIVLVLLICIKYAFFN